MNTACTRPPPRDTALRLSIVALVALFLLPAAAARAQCEPTWLAGPHQGVAGVDGTVRAMTRWDPDGPGPLTDWLVIGGRFSIAGDTAANNIVAWDGVRFHALGDGLEGVGGDGVRALTVYNGELIAGGQIYSVEGQQTPGVAAWDGAHWRPVRDPNQPTTGFGRYIAALSVYNGELIAAGRFTGSDGTTAMNIARWNGASWSPLDTGVPGPVNALLVHNGDLIAGGQFSNLNGSPARNVARWDGFAWTPVLGERFLQEVLSLGEYQGALIAGTHGGVLRWNGLDWEPFGSNWHARSVYAMLMHDGSLLVSGSDLMVLRNDTWERFESGPVFDPIFPAYALGSIAGDVIVGGNFTRARGVRSRGLIRYTPAAAGAWLPFGSGFEYDIKRAGTWTGQLVVTGSFHTVAGVEARGIARWDGQIWRAFGIHGVPISANAIADHAGDLYLGGVDNPNASAPRARLARWEGDDWALLDIAGDNVAALLSAPGGLIVAGEFSSAGAVPTANIARLDAAGAWHAMGDGFDARVSALAAYNADIFAAGPFTASGAVPLNNLARWDGVSWQPVGDFPGGTVRTLAVYDGELIAGGLLSFEGSFAPRAAAWNGLSWRPLAGDIPGDHIVELAVFDGRLISAGSQPLPADPLQPISEWNGNTWIPFDEQPNNFVSDLAVFNNELIAVGRFTQIGDLGSAYWARYGPTPSPLCPADLDCDSQLTPFDLVDYINLWFAAAPTAERTNDLPAAIDVFDLLAYLDEWFTGC